MAIIPTPTLRKLSGCALCGIAGVETVTTADGRFALCPDHMTKLAAGCLSADDRAMLDQKKQDSRGRWQDGPCALCADAADLLFEEAEGLFAFCQPHFIRYVLLALRPDEHAQLLGRLTPDQFLTRLSPKYYFEGAAEHPYFEDLEDSRYAGRLWETG